jgi:hypothetical protein
VNEKYGRRVVREFWLAKDALLSILSFRYPISAHLSLLILKIISALGYSVVSDPTVP